MVFDLLKLPHQLELLKLQQTINTKPFFWSFLSVCIKTIVKVNVKDPPPKKKTVLYSLYNE